MSEQKGGPLFPTEIKRTWIDGRILFPIVILGLFILAIAFLTKAFLSRDYERELTIWRIRADIIAESRIEAIEQWLKRHLNDLNALAANESIQLYTASILEADTADTNSENIDEIEGLRDYLRNVLDVTASRSGYNSNVLSRSNFNEAIRATGGIGIVAIDGTLVAASANSPPFTGNLKSFVQNTALNESAISPLYLDARGEPAMIFTAPLFAVQSPATPTNQIGRLFAVKAAKDELFPLLRQPGEIVKKAVSVLLLKQEKDVVFLSPIEDPDRPIRPLSVFPQNTPDLDAAFAVFSPGSFDATRKNYRGERVLMTSRRFSLAPWVLMYSLDYKEALGPVEARLRTLTIALSLGGLTVILAMVALWRHGSSLRASEMSRKYQHLAEEFETQKNLLELVTDSQPSSIYILDMNRRYRFANQQAAKVSGITRQEMMGKEIKAVLGPALARRSLSAHEAAAKADTRVTDTTRLTIDGEDRVIKSEHIPLHVATGELSGVLGIEWDITDVVTERERRARILQNLVKTLVDVVDARDSFAAHHSMRVAKIARAMAAEMNLAENLAETAEIAGNLLNFGKIMIARDILSKTTDLSEEERKMVRNLPQLSAKALEDIEFDGPVIETLRQAQERFDGSGPRGLKGEDILVTARIIAVANAFIGMTSDRAFRQALSLDQTIDLLFKDSGKAFDRRAVAALVNYLDNRGGRQALEDMARSAPR